MTSAAVVKSKLIECVGQWSEKHGFVALDKEQLLEGSFNRWAREVQWRTEYFEASDNVRDPYRLYLNAFLDLGSLGGKEPRYFDGLGLGAYDIASGARRLTGHNVFIAARLRRAVQRGLRWFEQFATPIECLKRLDAGITFYGPPTSEAARHRRAWLMQLIAKQNREPARGEQRS